MTVEAGVRLALLSFSAVALLVRSPSAFARRTRPMWLALLALTVELLLLQNPIGVWVSGLTPVTHLAVFLGGFCHMALTMAIWTITASDPRRPGARTVGNKWRWWFAGACVVVILLAETAATMQQITTRGGLPTEVNALTVGWGVYLFFIAVSSGDATVRLWRQLRVIAFPTLRLALGLLSVGTAASLVYVAARVITLVHLSTHATAVVLYSSTVYFLCFTAGCVTVLVGPLVEAVTAWRQRWQLFDLWRSVTRVVPDVVFEDCPTFWQDVRRVRGNKIRLQRRVVEIQDAALILREWVTPEQMDGLADEVEALGLTGSRAAAALAARSLELGRDAKGSGAPRSEVVPDAVSGGGADIGSELRWLMLVRQAYRDVPPTAADAAQVH